MHADDKLSAFVELERQVLTVTFYLESIHAGGEGNVERTIPFSEADRKLYFTGSR